MQNNQPREWVNSPAAAQSGLLQDAPFHPKEWPEPPIFQDSGAVCASEKWSRDSTPRSMSIESFSTDRRFHDVEPCHLAITQDEEASMGLAHHLENIDEVPELFDSEAVDETNSTGFDRESQVSYMDWLFIDPESMQAEVNFSEFVKVESSDVSAANSDDEKTKYQCPACHKNFVRSFNFKTHLETHDPCRERNFHCSRAHCHQSFYRQTDLKRHDQSVHMKSKAFLCEQCGNGFPRKDSLQRHMTDGCSRRPKIRRHKNSKKRQLQNKIVRIENEHAPQSISTGEQPLVTSGNSWATQGFHPGFAPNWELPTSIPQ